MMKTMMALLTAGTLLFAFAGCDKAEGGKEGKDGKAESKAEAKGGGDTGVPECDEALKKAAAPGCKDKPGISAITANKENWKNLASVDKNSAVMACKASLDAIKAAGCN